MTLSQRFFDDEHGTAAFFLVRKLTSSDFSVANSIDTQIGIVVVLPRTTPKTLEDPTAAEAGTRPNHQVGSNEDSTVAASHYSNGKPLASQN